MTIVRADLGLYKSLSVNDTSANGGRMSSTAVASGAVANLFAAVGEAERAAGSIKYRKVFYKVNSDNGDTFYSPQVFWANYTPGDDILRFFPATQTDTQAAITGSEQRYGCGQLDANISASATALDVECEEGNTDIFIAGMTIFVSDKTDIDDGVGNRESRVIDDVTAVVGNVVSLTLTVALNNAYLAAATKVSSVYAPSNLAVAIDNFVVTSAGDGDFDDEDITFNNRGAIEQTWTITYTNATNFTIVGDTVGSVETGTVGAGAAPNNPAFTKPYFTMPSGGFSGTWQAGDTIVFRTHPNCVPLWIEDEVPVAAGITGSNSATIRILGEQA